MLVCKYLAPLQPPPSPFGSTNMFSLDGRPMESITTLVRFVSQIPFLEDMQAFIGDMGALMGERVTGPIMAFMTDVYVCACVFGGGGSVSW